MQTTDYGIRITETRAKFEMQKFERERIRRTHEMCFLETRNVKLQDFEQEWIRRTHEMCFCYGFDKALYLEWIFGVA